MDNRKKKHRALQCSVFLHDRKYTHRCSCTVIERAPCNVHAERFRRVRLETVESAAAERGSEHNIKLQRRGDREREREARAV